MNKKILQRTHIRRGYGSYFYVAVIKQRDQSQLMKERVYFGLDYIRKITEHYSGSKTISHAALCLLLQGLALGSCPDFPQ